MSSVPGSPLTVSSISSLILTATMLGTLFYWVFLIGRLVGQIAILVQNTGKKEKKIRNDRDVGMKVIRRRRRIRDMAAYEGFRDRGRTGIMLSYLFSEDLGSDEQWAFLCYVWGQRAI